MKQQQRTVVLYPAPGTHLIAMVEFGKLIHLRLQLPVTVLIASPPFNFADTTPYITAVESSNLGVSFHHLPPPLDFSPQDHDAQNPALLVFKFQEACNTRVKEALESLSQSCTIIAFVIDFFCISSMSIVNRCLGLPVYVYLPSAAGALAVFLYLRQLHSQSELSFRDLNADLHIPGIPPLPSLDMLAPTLDRGESYYYFLDVSSQMSRAQGIIVNTFDALEPRALRAISDGLCVPDGPTPPIYTIGPVIAAGDETDRGAECLDWLGSQPDGSVVFLCFGSLGRFSVDQLGEIADGLERSGHRFLWVVRGPPSGSGPAHESADPDPKELLPEGFMDRTRGKGLVVRSWAPQKRVLKHVAVGGFVSHCGSNSILESVCAGVPLVAWPLYAEHHIHRLLLVKEMAVAVSVQEGPDGLVSAAEVERCVRLLMSSEEGARLRERAEAMRDAAAAAVKDGGSSWASLMRLGDEWESKAGKEDGA